MFWKAPVDPESILVHELAHSAITQAQTLRIEALSARGVRGPFKIINVDPYGEEAVSEMAKNDPAGATLSPDAYRLHAEDMFKIAVDELPKEN